MCYMTERGLRALQAEYERLESKLREIRQNRSRHGAALTGMNSDRQSDEQADTYEEGLLVKRRDTIGAILRTVKPAPQPTSISRVALGLVITVEFLDENGDLERTREYYLAGQDEPESTPGLEPVSIAGPLGAAIRGKEKDDEVQYLLPCGKPQLVRIANIAFPSLSIERDERQLKFAVV